MCLWELQDNTGSSPSLIRFTYRRWPLKMYEDIEDNGGTWRHSHWRLWQEKTFSEDYGAWRLSSFVVSFLLCWVIGTIALLSGVQVNKVRVTEVMLNQNHMPSREENEGCWGTKQMKTSRSRFLVLTYENVTEEIKNGTNADMLRECLPLSATTSASPLYPLLSLCPYRYR